MGMDNKLNNKRSENFNLYIYKVLKQIHPEVGISKKAMQILNSFVLDTFENIAEECGKLTKYGNKQTLTGREIKTACRLLLPGELAKHVKKKKKKKKRFRQY